MRLRECAGPRGELEGGRVREGVMLRPGTGGGVHHIGKKYDPGWLWRQRRQRGSGKMGRMRVNVEC